LFDGLAHIQLAPIDLHTLSRPDRPQCDCDIILGMDPDCRRDPIERLGGVR
jgi:hypothetical protein